MSRPSRIRICWPNPDATCLQGGCAHCQDEPPRARSTIENYAKTAGQVPNRSGNGTVDAWQAWLYGEQRRGH